MVSYVGDSAVLLAFDLDQEKTANLAGFSIRCITPSKGQYQTNDYFLQNLLNFNDQITGNTSQVSIKPVGSDKAPFQQFHWMHFPSAGPGQYQYIAYASYFNSNGSVQLGPSVTANFDLEYKSFPNLEVGFTRGDISSQAYSDRFSNAPIRPAQKSIDFDTTPFQNQYQWLGAHARKLVFDFLNECQQDPSINLDVFVFDFDEPDIINSLCKLGSRVRVLQDDAPLHMGPNAMEPQATTKLQAAGVAVKKGHFNRFAHDKIMIQTRNGSAVKVLTGSANFSIRGLYVQANSVLVFDDPVVASLYEQAFQTAFALDFSNPGPATRQFATSAIGSKWNDINENDSNLPPLSVSFAPHGQVPAGQSTFSIEKISQAIQSAKSSILFAVMQMSGGGDAMSALLNLGNRTDLLSLGIIQNEGQLQLFKPGNTAAFTSFDFLSKNIPEPFKSEWGGGAGEVIHHKFVVCDFNGASPIVFCGSSNLSAGGEAENGDNLIAIYDKKIAIYYAVEAIRLFDHYQFRRLHQQSTSDKPLMLDSTDNWAKPFYDPQNIKSLQRQVLSSPT